MRPHFLWILLAGGVVYLNSLDNSFHYDDSHAIVENPHLRSLDQIPGFFADPSDFSREPAMAMYRPVLLTSLALNYAVGAYQVRGYHLVNVLIHSLVALLVCAILGELCASLWAGWWAGMLFALHPVHTQGGMHRAERIAAHEVGGKRGDARGPRRQGEQRPAQVELRDDAQPPLRRRRRQDPGLVVRFRFERLHRRAARDPGAAGVGVVAAAVQELELRRDLPRRVDA